MKIAEHVQVSGCAFLLREIVETKSTSITKKSFCGVNYRGLSK